MVAMAQVVQHLNGWPSTLAWSQFRRVGQTAGFDAQTSPRYSYRFRGVRKRNGEYQPGVTATLTLNRTQTVVRTAWLGSADATAKTHLLEHEQGHYDIAGLLLRDFLYDSFNSAMNADVVAVLTAAGTTTRSHTAYAHGEIRGDVEAAWQRFRRLIALVDAPDAPDGTHRGLYERDTDHGANRRGQERWTRMLRWARTTNTSLAITLFVHGVVNEPPG